MAPEQTHEVVKSSKLSLSRGSVVHRRRSRRHRRKTSVLLGKSLALWPTFMTQGMSELTAAKEGSVCLVEYVGIGWLVAEGGASLILEE